MKSMKEIHKIANTNVTMSCFYHVESKVYGSDNLLIGQNRVKTRGQHIFSCAYLPNTKEIRVSCLCGWLLSSENIKKHGFPKLQTALTPNG